jgi:hypothetical protein
VVPEWQLVLVRLGTDKNINCDLYDAVLQTVQHGSSDGDLKKQDTKKYQLFVK